MKSVETEKKVAQLIACLCMAGVKEEDLGCIAECLIDQLYINDDVTSFLFRFKSIAEHAMMVKNIYDHK